MDCDSSDTVTKDRLSPQNGQSQSGEQQSSLCLPFEIAEDPEIGRHFVATRDIQPLELIFRDTPLVVGPATKYDGAVCLECLKPVNNSPSESSCPRCQFPVCSPVCLENLGKLHSEKECVHLQNCPPDER